MSQTQLCEHVQQVHYEYLHEELPRLDFTTRRVAAVHGDHEPRLLDVRRTFEEFQSAMVAHTKDEDEVVFPAIRKLESGDGGQTGAEAELNALFDKLESELE